MVVSLRLRRIATAASTLVVALVLSIVVPVSQLHTFSQQIECCCPNPDHCQCPDHDEVPSQPTMKACHKVAHDFVAPVLPAFVTPEIEIASAPPVIAIEPVLALADPHPAPEPTRPDAPS